MRAAAGLFIRITRGDGKSTVLSREAEYHAIEYNVFNASEQYF